MKINYSLPVQMYDFKKDNENENFTRCKIKVFHDKETADHRIFSAKCMEQMIASLPYTPIVGYYDEEKEDFVGHATQQQIFGVVDPCTDLLKVSDQNGETWTVCEGVLYTDRPDKVGTIAQKIIGHKQSLEINPSTVEYKINYDERKHFKNLEFTAGTFIGLSVLGNDEKPAFTGSEFFSQQDFATKFKDRIDSLIKYCQDSAAINSNSTSSLSDKQGGNKVSTMNFLEFMKLSWGEISEKVLVAVQNDYPENYMGLVDMYEDYAIFRAYYPTGTNKLLRINYSIDNGEVVLGDVSEVRVVYEPIEETSDDNDDNEFSDTTPTASENVEGGSESSSETEPSSNSITVNNAEGTSDSVLDNSLTMSNEPGITETELSQENVESTGSDFSTETTNGNSGTTDNFTEDKEPTSNAEETGNDGTQEENFNTTQSEDNSSSATFTDGERAEFEALKREKKINIINSYKAYLSEEEYNNFINSVDSYADNDKLEFDLLKIFRAFTEAHAHESNSKTTVPFSFNTNGTPEAQDSVQDYMKRLLKR